MNNNHNEQAKQEAWEQYKNVLTDEILAFLNKAEDIEVFTREQTDRFAGLTFAGYLEHLMEEKGLKKSQIIKASGINESFAYQIFNGYKNPSRDKLLALAIGMQLTLTECRRFLKLAGVSELYAKNRRDAIIIFGLNKNLSIFQINDILFDMDEFML